MSQKQRDTLVAAGSVVTPAAIGGRSATIQGKHTPWARKMNELTERIAALKQFNNNSYEMMEIKKYNNNRNNRMTGPYIPPPTSEKNTKHNNQLPQKPQSKPKPKPKPLPPHRMNYGIGVVSPRGLYSTTRLPTARFSRPTQINSSARLGVHFMLDNYNLGSYVSRPKSEAKSTRA